MAALPPALLGHEVRQGLVQAGLGPLHRLGHGPGHRGRRWGMGWGMWRARERGPGQGCIGGAPSLCPATVSLTPNAGFNGIPSTPGEAGCTVQKLQLHL